MNSIIIEIIINAASHQRLGIPVRADLFFSAVKNTGFIAPRTNLFQGLFKDFSRTFFKFQGPFFIIMHNYFRQISRIKQLQKKKKT